MNSLLGKKDAVDAALAKAAQQGGISPDLKRFFASDREALIFGAGNQAQIAWLLCLMFNKKIRALLTSGARQRVVSLPPESDLPLFTLGDENAGLRECDVLVAVNEKLNGEISSTLAAHGFSHVFTSEAWLHDNNALFEIFGDTYIGCHGSLGDHNGVPVARIPYEGGGELKFVYPREMNAYKMNFIGQFLTVMLPQAFKDQRCPAELPYECPPHVVLKKGDTVIDCGANIGAFSVMAAASGCRVLAFEPAQNCLPHLQANAALYDNITVIPKALSDSSGPLEFFYNPGQGSDGSMDKGNQFAAAGADYVRQTVDAVTLDAFVEQYPLEEVNFIKADIEGAERNMLRGAQKTLQRFAPKLAVCSYHLPDDPAVLEKLILDADAGYKIVHSSCQYNKIYACKP